MPSSAASLAYHEPGIVIILLLGSFLMLQTAINYVFDRLLYCGLIGQIAIGMAWGAPGANWLPLDSQNTIVQLGGLQTNIKTLKSNLWLSSLVALVGISAPIGLSFTLHGFVGSATPLQSFAAGAALCSTSLGTTFTILSTSGLSQSRLGVVLSSAAMMDDIVGLVMSGIISRLGETSDFHPTTVIRPVFVSVAFAVTVPLFCIFAVKPLTKVCFSYITAERNMQVRNLLITEKAAFVFHVLILTALVTGASYAGTSNLFAAYLAGVSITWWDGLCLGPQQSDSPNEAEHRAEVDSHGEESEPSTSSGATNRTTNQPNSAHQQQVMASVPDDARRKSPSPHDASKVEHSSISEKSRRIQTSELLTGAAVFKKYMHPSLQAILKPFFFASIGFSIPISRMFDGHVVWRGIVYSVLMIMAKLLCGLCLIRLTSPVIFLQLLRSLLAYPIQSCFPWPLKTRKLRKEQSVPERNQEPPGHERSQTDEGRSHAPRESRIHSQCMRPVSLYPAALLGSAMVARGEIGFLISSIAESEGVFGPAKDGSSSELFLIVTWAILLCTILGPLSVGLLVRRVKRLQDLERSRKTGREDPLGIWGIAG